MLLQGRPPLLCGQGTLAALMASKQSLRADRGVADRAVLLGRLGLGLLLGLWVSLCFWRTFGPSLGLGLFLQMLGLCWQRILRCLDDSFGGRAAARSALGTPFGLSLCPLLGGLLWLSFFLFALWFSDATGTGSLLTGIVFSTAQHLVGHQLIPKLFILPTFSCFFSHRGPY